MITLSSTTDKIQVYLSGSVTTNNINCYAAYRDTTTTSISPIGYYTASNGSGPVDLVTSPASSTQRLVEYISVHNTDTAPAEAYIHFSDNGTNYILQKAILQPNDKLEYSDKNGFKVISNVGTVKTNFNQVNVPTSTSQSISVLDRDIIFAPSQASSWINTELAAFGFPVEENALYSFDLLAFYDVSATTNGARFNLLTDGGDLTGYYYWKSLTTTSWTVAYAITTPLTAPSGVDASSAATTANHVIIRGFIRAGEDEFIKLWLAPEEASPSTITLKAGSRIQYFKVA